MAKPRVPYAFPSVARWAAALMLVAMISACAGPDIPKRRIGSASQLRPPAHNLRQCLAKLSSADVRYSSLPDRSFGGGCNAIGSVKLLDIGVPATNLGAMTCPLAANFAAWARFGVQPAARMIMGSEIVRIETFGTYACRPVAGTGRLSEHAHSNAVDVSAFLLADGRRIAVKGGWNGGSAREQQFLRTVRASACKRFNTVLSPDYNAAHHDHLHFDMGNTNSDGSAYCR